MARIRTIKPEFFRHLELYMAEKETGLPLRLAYAGLWCVADRDGRFRWQPEVLKLDVLPFDDIDFSRVLDALATRDFIVKYAKSGKEYGVIPTFKTHQVINNRERPSVFPSPEESDAILDTSTRASRVPHACLTPLCNAQGEREREKEKEKEIEVLRTSCSEPQSDSEPNVTKPIKSSEQIIATPAPPDSPIVCEIPIIGPKGTYQITQAMIDDWQETFPGIDVLLEVKSCRAWNQVNPTRQKTRKGIARHVVSWLQRAQNRGGVLHQTKSKMPIVGQTKTFYSNAVAISQAVYEIQGQQEGDSS